MNKREIRERILSLRASLSPQEVKRRSEGIVSKIQEIPEWGIAENYLLYFPIKNEVETELLFESLIREGKEVFYPRVVEKELEIVRVQSLKDFQEGIFKIPEPVGESFFKVNHIDIIVVPSVAIDQQGFRLGYGGGYYDRTLKSYQGVTVCPIFDFQMVSSLPHDSWDLICDYVVNEKGFCGGQKWPKMSSVKH